MVAALDTSDGKDAIEMEAIAKAKLIENRSSQIGDDRPISSCAFCNNRFAQIVTKLSEICGMSESHSCAASRVHQQIARLWIVEWRGQIVDSAGLQLG